MDSNPEIEWPYKLSGSSGPLICLIHGFLGSKNDWSLITDDLSKDARCISYDLPGHGSNLAPHGINELSSAVKELDVQRHLAFREPWHLVGYSMGGRFVLQYAMMFPQNVLSLTLISSSPGIDDDEARMKRRKDDAAWASKVQMMPASAFIDEWYEQPVFNSLASNPELKQKILASRRDFRSRQMAQILQNWGQGNVPSMWSRLPDIQCPVQVVIGREDKMYAYHATRMRDLSRSVQVVMVDDAGHTAHLEQPGVVMKCIQDFVRKN